jgi:AcrR family transcriptional regulator
LKNAERSESSHERLLAAAIETLELVGYNRFRTADVAKRSGLSEGTLFYYFPTKYALVAGATKRVLDEYLDRAAAAYGHLTPPVDRRLMLELLWDVLSDKRLNWTHELYAAVQGDPQLAEAVGPIIVESTRQTDEAAIVVMRAFGGVPEEECQDCADLAIWSMKGLIGRDMARGPSGLERELIDYLVFLVDTVHRLPSVAT